MLSQLFGMNFCKIAVILLLLLFLVLFLHHPQSTITNNFHLVLPRLDHWILT